MAEAKKKTAKKTSETDKPVFPVEGFVNQWGFIHLSQEIIEAFGVPKEQKATITIDLKDRSPVISKA